MLETWVGEKQECEGAGNYREGTATQRPVSVPGVKRGGGPGGGGQVCACKALKAEVEGKGWPRGVNQYESVHSLSSLVVFKQMFVAELSFFSIISVQVLS